MAGAHEINEWLNSLPEDQRAIEILRMHRLQPERVFRTKGLDERGREIVRNIETLLEELKGINTNQEKPI